MKVPVATVVAGVVLVGAGAVALVRSTGNAGASDPPGEGPVAEPAEVQRASAAQGPPPQLPPNHPPIHGAAPNGGAGAPVGTPDEPAAIAWTPPSAWQVSPNPNAMRIATYRPSPEVEVVVARAGGTTDANIDRWIGQFDEPPRSRRSRRVVNGLPVELVEVHGTYGGGAMMPGAPSQPHPDWALLGAVVESPGSHYFFKLVGPSAQVLAAQKSFDELVASVRPAEGQPRP